MPNLAGQALDYIKGLGSRSLGIADSIGERSAAGLSKYIGSAMRNPFARRTSLGAIGGGIIGGIYGGASDNGSVLGSGLMGAGLGAAGARYGGTFLRAGMTPGIGVGYAGRMAMASGRSDFRMAMRQGKSTASLIGNTMTSGMGRIRGLFR